MIRKIQWFAMAVTAVLCAACDAHIDVPDTAVRPGHILCEDGTALSYVQYEQSGKRAIAVVFDTEHREGTEGNGYAVYLWDIAPAAFADSLGVAQGTSADIEALDGNMNTFALYEHGRRLRLWRKRSLTCGGTDRVPISRRWHRCGCCMPSGKPSILSSNGVAAIRCRWMKTTAGTGHRRR